MTSLKVRNIDFGIDDSVPFEWHASNPQWGRIINRASFLFVAFEKYIMRTMSAAKALVRDPDVLEERTHLLPKRRGIRFNISGMSI